MGTDDRRGGNKLKKWPYESTGDPKYIKDKDEFFKKSGNGWWLSVDVSQTKTRLTGKLKK